MNERTNERNGTPARRNSGMGARPSLFGNSNRPGGKSAIEGFLYKYCARASHHEAHTEKEEVRDLLWNSGPSKRGA